MRSLKSDLCFSLIPLLGHCFSLVAWQVVCQKESILKWPLIPKCLSPMDRDSFCSQLGKGIEVCWTEHFYLRNPHCTDTEWNPSPYYFTIEMWAQKSPCQHKYLLLTKVPVATHSISHFHLGCRPHRWMGTVVWLEPSRGGRFYRQVVCHLWSISPSHVVQCVDFVSIERMQFHQ